MKFRKQVEVFFDNFPEMIRKRKWFVWGLAIGFTVFAFFGMNKAKFDMTIEGWFNANDPVKVAMDEFKVEFGSDDGIYIVYKPKDENVFSSKSLELVSKIREDLLNKTIEAKEDQKSVIKHIIKITTLVNAPILKSDNDILVSKPLVGKVIPVDQNELATIQNLAESERSFSQVYFSKDKKYGGIMIETDFGTERMDLTTENQNTLSTASELVMDDETVSEKETVQFKPTDANLYFALMKEINQILEKPEFKEHFEYHVVGNAAMATENMNILNEEGGLMYLSLLLIMALLIWIFARSFSAVVWSLLIVSISVIWTIGISGWIGIEITAFVVLTVMLILTVGICDAVHVISGYMLFRNNGDDRWSAIVKVFKSTRQALFMTSFTTVIGMLSLFIAPIPRVRVFGLMSALGVACAFIITISLLPLMLNLWSPDNVKKNQKKKPIVRKIIPNFSVILQNSLKNIIPLVQKSPISVLIMFIALFAITVYGALILKVDTNLATQFYENSPFRKAVQIVDKEMMGSQSMEIYIDLKNGDAFEDPFVLNKIDGLQRNIEKKYSNLVVKTSSIVEIVKNAYQTLNEGRDEMYKIPADQQTLSQTLYMFNSANPEDRRKIVSDDYSKSHITVNLLNVGSKEFLNVYDNIIKDIDNVINDLKVAYPNANVSITGMLPLNMKFAKYIANSGINSFILALIGITLSLVFAYRSIGVGLISILPNLIPSLLTFSLLGLTGKPLDFEVMVMIPVIIGIAVDDTIHFICHYRDCVKVNGDVLESLKSTMMEVGPAAFQTSLILGLGFSVMAFSKITGTANIGKIGPIAIFVALLNDLLLLPAIILIFKPKFQSKTMKSVSAA